jgi:hypothetical protein
MEVVVGLRAFIISWAFSDEHIVPDVQSDACAG